MALYLYDDAKARSFEPYALTRPMGELRAGVSLIRHRWEHALGVRAAGAVVAAHLTDFEELDAPPAVTDVIHGGAVLAHTRCVVRALWRERQADVWTCEGRVAAVRLGADLPIRELADGDATLETLGAGGTRVVDVAGRWLEEVWSLITQLPVQLADDIARLGPQIPSVGVGGATVIGEYPVFVEQGAVIEPLVVLDATGGSILVRDGATVRAFTRLVGPCAVAPGATILGGRVAGCSIGETSVISGDISESVVLGHANKGHEGFVGHSYLGRWVNLGAGTTTSNLKNTYGPVALWTPSGVRDTGTTKLGTLFGDHVKTGIGLRLTTGCVIGAGSNVYGSAVPPKYVPPFTWGDGSAPGGYDAGRFLVTARRAMSRRGVALGARGERLLLAAHARARRGEAGSGGPP
jgi:UDP-N-acetylglucosamine diphosphorylase/glucosamine-1-phosphate N-acetyltransferase